MALGLLAGTAFFLWFKPPRWRPGPWALLDLQPIALQGRQRLLVVSPHCDDETLGAAGLMLAARRAGMDVKVVFMTNGDGFRFATVEHARKAFPKADDYIAMGKVRQKEARAALRILGVTDAVFLAYPDRGLASLWDEHWRRDNPFRSRYTRCTQSPYPDTFRPGSVFCGDDLLSDVSAIVESYQPDLIVYPHPNDVHPDHWATSAFVRLALAMEREVRPSYHPLALAYLVHRPDFPQPRDLRPEACLTPPPPIRLVTPRWFRLDLTEEDKAAKQAAVEAYESQLPVLRRLLNSFVRRNECFGQEHSAPLPHFGSGDPTDASTWRDPDGHAIAPVRSDPVKDGVVHDAVGASDLRALYVARRDDGALLVCLASRRRPKRTLDYVLRAVVVQDSGPRSLVAGHAPLHAASRPVATVKGHYVSYVFPPDAVGEPRLLFVGAEVDALSGRAEDVQLNMLDQVAWQQIDVQPAAPIRSGLAPALLISPVVALSDDAARPAVAPATTPDSNASAVPAPG